LLEKGLIGRIRKGVPKKIKIIGQSEFKGGLKFKGVHLTKKLEGKINPQRKVKPAKNPPVGREKPAKKAAEPKPKAKPKIKK